MLVLLVGVGFVVRLLPLVLPFDFSGPDSISYTAPAASLAAGEGYRDEHGQPTAGRPPAYPALVAVTYWVQGSQSPTGARLLQAALGALAALLVQQVLRRGGAPPGWALAGGALVALDPVAIGQSPFILREALLGFLVAALLWSRTLAGRARLSATAAVLALATLTHQLYVLLFAFLFAADALAVWRSRDPRRWARARWTLAGWIAIGLVVALALFLWARRNERVIGHLSFTATANPVPARELWLTSECSNAWLSGDLDTGFQYMAFAEERRLMDELGLDGAKAELYRRTWANWRDHPLRSLGRLARLNLWYWLEVPGAVRLAGSPRLRWTRAVLLPFHWARLCAACAGVLLLVRTGAWRTHRATLGCLAFFALAPALLYPVPRYLGPACPALDLLALLGLQAAWTARGRAGGNP